jgi:hypothetical protein
VEDVDRAYFAVDEVHDELRGQHKQTLAVELSAKGNARGNHGLGTLAVQ